MNIIGGQFRGRVIHMPDDIRPTNNKVRAALFEILKDRIQGAMFLDLYAGSGAIGIEALSRGAKRVDFVENQPKCMAMLNRNLKDLGISQEYSHIYKSDAARAIKLFSKNRVLFDIIFMDPPYYKDLAKNTLIEISSCDILTANAFVVSEVFKKDFLPDQIGNLKKFRTYRYGDTMLEIFVKHEFIS